MLNNLLSKRLGPLLRLSIGLGLMLVVHILLSAGTALAQAPIIALPPGFVEDVVVGDLKLPTGFAFSNDGRIFFAEKAGRVRIYQNGTLLPEPFIDISGEVNNSGDRGLLSIALHPNFPGTPYVYLAYVYESAETKSYPSEGARTSRVLRVSADPGNPNVVQQGSGIILLGKNSIHEHIGNPNEAEQPPFTCMKPEGGHVQDCLPVESRAHTVDFMMFGHDGALYVSNGDGTVNTGGNWRAQDIDSLGGKILRINPISGEGYGSNPFFDGDPNSNRSKVYAYGLRNPYRFTLHPSTGELWVGEVGNDVWEEISRGGPGSNFGWPCYEGPDQASGEPICQQLYASGSPVMPAVHAYLHEEGLGAAIGGDFYTRGSYPAAYNNAYFFADFNAGLILILPPGNRSSPQVFAASVRGPVQITRGPDSNLYVLSITNGLLSRIRTGTKENAPVLDVPSLGGGAAQESAVPNAPAAAVAPAAPAPVAAPANRRPSAVIIAEPTAGRGPLTVEFTAAESTDPDGDLLTYSWDFGDGTGTGDSATSVLTGTHTYTATGTYTATLTVTDPEGAEQSQSVEIAVGNDPPVAKILRPYPQTTFHIGDKVQYVGTGTDTEDGRIELDNMRWEAFLHHNDHLHFDAYSAQGRLGSFDYTDHGDNTYLELCLTVTDSAGLEDKDCIDLRPQEVTYTFHSIPSGVRIIYAGSSYKTPFRVTTYVNAERQIGAPRLPAEGVTFLNWSNSGERSQRLTTRATNQTLIATFDGVSDELEGNTEIVDVNQLNLRKEEAPQPVAAASAPAPVARAVVPQPSVPAVGEGAGQILREWWTEIPGSAVENLLQHETYPGAPSGSDFISAFEAPRSFDDDYGTRIHGYLHPPATAEYIFWIAADDSAQLVLSTDDNPANGIIIAATPAWTHSQEWDRYPQQRSIGIQLEAGKRYYIEARHKESDGKDNLAVSWLFPGAGRTIIEGSYLSPFISQ